MKLRFSETGRAEHDVTARCRRACWSEQQEGISCVEKHLMICWNDEGTRTCCTAGSCVKYLQQVICVCSKHVISTRMVHTPSEWKVRWKCFYLYNHWWCCCLFVCLESKSTELTLFVCLFIYYPNLPGVYQTFSLKQKGQWLWFSYLLLQTSSSVVVVVVVCLTKQQQQACVIFAVVLSLHQTVPERTVTPPVHRGVHLKIYLKIYEVV